MPSLDIQAIPSQTKILNPVTFSTFKTLVENKSNSKIKAVQTYRGGEFRPSSAFCKDHDIIHRVTYPYAHQQKASVKRNINILFKWN